MRSLLRLRGEDERARGYAGFVDDLRGFAAAVAHRRRRGS
jgi:hypothetical protein